MVLGQLDIKIELIYVTQQFHPYIPKGIESLCLLKNLYRNVYKNITHNNQNVTAIQVSIN